MKLRFLAFLVGVAALLALAVPPASANTSPPKAPSCTAQVAAVGIDDPANLVATAGFMQVTGVVACQLDGVLTNAPVSYLDFPYKGSIVAGALVNGISQPCIGTPSGYFYAVGPTLVMTATATCQFSFTEPPGTVHFPILWWSTEDYSGNQKTQAAATGPAIEL